jgi:hypothetical protein
VFPYLESLLIETATLVFTSKVDIEVMLRRLVDIYFSSDGRECHFSAAWNMGHAWASEMVCGRSRVYHMHSFDTRDAWAKHKDLDPYEAKWLYVGTLMKARFHFLLSS